MRNSRIDTQPLKVLDFVVLAILNEEPLHGYALAQALAERRQHPVRPGDLYRVLYRMAQAGLIEEAPRSRTHDTERRVEYRITPNGRRRAQEEARLLQSVCDTVLKKGRAVRDSGIS